MGLIRTVVADPPWLERGGGAITRGAQKHYPLMPKEQILQVMAEAMGLVWWSGMPRTDCQVDVSSSHLWMWVTDNYLRGGLWLMDQLGWRYLRTMAWVKVSNHHHEWEPASACEIAREGLQIGLGQYMRGSHELCLLGVRGDACVPPPENRVPSVIFAERRKHSAKPEEAFQVFESVSPGPYMEIFARSQRPGWRAFGNEIGATASATDAPPIAAVNSKERR